MYCKNSKVGIVKIGGGGGYFAFISVYIKPYNDKLPETLPTNY